MLSLSLALLPSLVPQLGGIVRSPTAADCLRRSSTVVAQNSQVDPVELARMQEKAKKLDPDAAALLEEVDGDAQKARASHMGYTLAYVKEALPELYELIRTDPKHPDAHRALVEVTWDAIAAFLPVTHEPTLTAAAKQKLTAVARAGCDGSTEAPSVLDVGCGNGLLLPFVTACDTASTYRGIDVSEGMIERAQAAHAGDPMANGATFESLSFGEVLQQSEESPISYDAVFFNGALQFFAEPAAAIADAAKLLERKPSSRLVLSHLNGAAFVRTEREDNPQTVLSAMPTLAQLASIAEPLGLQVVLPAFYGEQPDDIARGLDDFYLVVLRWDDLALLGAEDP